MRPCLPALLSGNNMERNKVVESGPLETNVVKFGRLELEQLRRHVWFEAKVICAKHLGCS